MCRAPRWPRRNKSLRAARAAAFGLAGLALSLACGLAAFAQDNAPQSGAIAGEGAPQLGLMGTIPIYWGEVASFDELLADGGHTHWARAVIERQFALQPLDYLSQQALQGHSRLVLAQPRGFSAEENIALDGWVRGGGQLLMFVDPHMTGESRFGLGDRRRPQDVALVSPILAHWGLELVFDPAQDHDLAMRDYAGTPIPVRLSGTFAATGASDSCAIVAQGLVAQCQLGAGRAVILADAALLDQSDPAIGASQALEALLGRVFGDCAGIDSSETIFTSQDTENMVNLLSDLCGLDAPKKASLPP